MKATKPRKEQAHVWDSAAKEENVAVAGAWSYLSRSKKSRAVYVRLELAGRYLGTICLKSLRL